VSRSRKALTQEVLRKSSNSFIAGSAQKNFCEVNDNDVQKGLEKLFNDIRPGSIFTFNNRIIKVSTKKELEDELKKEFPTQYENLLCHYSQMAMQYATAFLFAIPRQGSLTEAGKKELSATSISADPRSSYLKVDFFTNKGNDTIFCRTTTLQPLNVIPGNEVNNHWSRIESVFQLSKAPDDIKKQEKTWGFRKPKPAKIGFELLSIRTDNDIVRQLFLGSVNETFFSRPPSPPSFLSRNGRKIVKGVSATLAVLGVATAIVGAFVFPPSMFLTVPILGKIGLALLLTKVGFVVGGSGAIANRVSALDNTKKSEAAVATSTSNGQRAVSSPDLVTGDSRTAIWRGMGITKENVKENSKENPKVATPVTPQLGANSAVTKPSPDSVLKPVDELIGIRRMMK